MDTIQQKRQAVLTVAKVFMDSLFGRFAFLLLRPAQGL